MENSNNIQKELMEICPVIGQIRKKDVYFVSPSYFEQLPNEILENINIGKEAKYYFTSTLPYSVPEGYFTALSEKILSKINQKSNESVYEELEAISPLLNTISKKPAYSIPAGYFDQVRVRPEITGQKKTTKVVSGNFLARVNKYAVAAILVSVICLGMFLFIGKDSEVTQKPNPVIADVQKLSEEDIVEFLKTTSVADAITLVPEKDKEQKKIEKSVSEMSEKEIRQFLKESGDYDEI